MPYRGPVAGFVQPNLEIAGLMGRRGQPVVEAVRALFVAVARESPELVERAVQALAARIAELDALAYILGRRRVELATRAFPVRAAGEMGGKPAGLVPKVTWAEAIRQIAERYPTIVPEEVRLLGSVAVQEWIGALYEARGLTLARTAQDVVVERVQAILRQAVKGGMTREAAVRQIVAAGAEHGDDFSRAYAETVFRNNLGTSYSAGLHDQMKDPAVQKAIGALMFQSIPDSDRTPICAGAHGAVAPSDDPLWDEWTPPLHHNCRSGLRFLTWTMLSQAGLLDENGRVRVRRPAPGAPRPQPGFGGRRTS